MPNTTDPGASIPEPDDTEPEPPGRCASGPPGLLGNPAGPIAASELRVSTVEPCAISSTPSKCVNDGIRRHRVTVSNTLRDAGALRRKLVVVLPGGGRDPDNIRTWQDSAAYAGYRTVGLTYSGSTLDDACPSVDRALSLEEEVRYGQCVEQFRSAVLYGGVVPDRGKLDSGLVLDPANSVEVRLLDLLKQLDRSDPEAGWSSYFKTSRSGALQLAYGKIIVAGYSLGSGHATRWAKDERFAGVVTLAGPTDGSTRLVPSSDPRKAPTATFVVAPWIGGSHATPGERRSALVHSGEGAEKLEVLDAVWDRFGLAPRAPIDLTHAWEPGTGRLAWPYEAAAARFTVSTKTNRSCSAHLSTAEDRCIAVDTDPATKMPRIFPGYMHLFCTVLEPGS